MIITSYYEYKTLVERMNRDKCVLTPIFRDPYYHRVENNVLCLGVTFENLDTYIISISHDDAPTFEIPCTDNTYTDYDIYILAYINNIALPKKEYDPYISNIHAQFQMFRDTNKIIPITSWGKYLRKVNTDLITIYSAQKHTLDTDVYRYVKRLSETLREIENAGLYVNKVSLDEHFDGKVQRYFKDNILYTEYNIFTTTGRPSNRFGGINFSALNKSDGSRETFISRYTDGILVQFDFEAYHLRLLADEHGFNLPSSSLHTDFAKKYFNTENVTDELYAASKQRTFEIMYGTTEETYGIPLFKHIVELRNTYKNMSGKLMLPSGITVNVAEPNASKLFNYHVQSLEMVKTLPKLQSILEVLKNTKNHLILYTYDSILLDMASLDVDLLRTIKDILEENKKFPVRVHIGKNYNDIVEFAL